MKTERDYHLEVCSAINRLREVHDSYRHRKHLVPLVGNDRLSALFQITSCQPAWTAREVVTAAKPRKTTVGILVRKGSFWIGVHYAPIHRRFCINLIPCVTVWVVLAGGDLP